MESLDKLARALTSEQRFAAGILVTTIGLVSPARVAHIMAVAEAMRQEEVGQALMELGEDVPLFTDPAPRPPPEPLTDDDRRHRYRCIEETACALSFVKDDERLRDLDRFASRLLDENPKAADVLDSYRRGRRESAG